MGVTVFIRALTGKTLEIELCDTKEEFKNITVEELRRRITDREGIPGDQIRLIYHGTEFEDGRRLSEYGVEHESTICMVLKLRGGHEVRDEEEEAGGMGDRDGRNRSMDRLNDLRCRLQ